MIILINLPEWKPDGELFFCLLFAHELIKKYIKTSG